MKKIYQYSILLLSLLIISCMEKPDKPKKEDEKHQFSGIVFSGYYKGCRYGLKTVEGEIGIDAMDIPDNLLDVKCDIVAEEIKQHAQGFDVLSKVTINGVRYLTKKEWHQQQDEIHKDDDPL